MPNLGKLNDVADYILDPAAGGYTSASETELDTDNEIEVMETTTQRVLGKREQQKLANNGDKKAGKTEQTSNVEKRAVKLVELGPRMRLRMVKVEEGVCEGKVMWNEYVTKTKEEEKALEEKWELRRKEKEARKKTQRDNVERKKELKKNTKKNAGKAGEEGAGEGESEEEWDSEDLENWDVDDDDDLEDVDDVDDVEDVGAVEEDDEMQG